MEGETEEMNFIRTTDENGNPVTQDPVAEAMTEPAREIIGLASSEEAGYNKRPQLEPLTQEQVDLLNQLMAAMDQNGYNSVDALIELRDLIDQQGISRGMKERVITEFVKAEYLDPNRRFTEQQAVSALHTLLGTPKEAALAKVKHWYQHPAE